MTIEELYAWSAYFRLKGEPVTYAEHGRDFNLTSTGGPNWYNIYTKGGLINKDIALAFKKVGFK